MGEDLVATEMILGCRKKNPERRKTARKKMCYGVTMQGGALSPCPRMVRLNPSQPRKLCMCPNLAA